MQGAEDPSFPVPRVSDFDALRQGVARVLSKLPSLQSMTQRLRSHSQRVLQPVTQQQLGRPAIVDEAEEVQESHESIQDDTDAHVMVFVHGFRVRSNLKYMSNRKPCI